MLSDMQHDFLKETRHNYIDIAKGFAIVAVVLWHINFNINLGPAIPLRTILGGGWHVPVFFIISGFFLKDEKISQPIPFIKGKLKTIYLWTIAIYIPAVLLHNTFIDLGFYSTNKVFSDSQVQQYYGIADISKKILEVIFFAGREPLVSPLWFAYVLCLALIGYSLITFLTKKISNNHYTKIRICICILLAAFSAIASNLFSFTINRFSNTLVVLLLLCCGQYIFQIKKIQFQSFPTFICTALVAWQNFIFNGNILLNDNKFHDLIGLIVGSICSLYVIVYISKKIEHSFFGNILQFIGEKSFYIMGLHLIAFKSIAYALNLVDSNVNIARLTPLSNNNPAIIVAYLFAGIGLPLLFAVSWKFIYHKFVSTIKSRFCK